MAATSSIEWTDATVNFWWGCTKVGPGCDHCYAEAHDKRFGGAHWGPGQPRRKIGSAAALLHRLDNNHSHWAADGACAMGNARAFGLPVPFVPLRRRVFINSMSDLFDLDVPHIWFKEAWECIGRCDRLNIQIVTKRITAVRKRLSAVGCRRWPEHAGLLVTVVNQAEADRDLPRLVALAAAYDIPWIGVSAEPLLGPLCLERWVHLLDQVIVGGESGREARPMQASWARTLRDQCAATGTPFFFKQWGEYLPVGQVLPGHGKIHGATAVRPGRMKLHYGAPPDIAPHHAFADRGVEFTSTGDGRLTFRIGKKRAGGLLDGMEHNGMPAPLARAAL